MRILWATALPLLALTYNVRWRFWSAHQKRSVLVSQLNTVRLVLCNWLHWEYERQVIELAVSSGVLAGQVVNFLTGCDPDDVSPDTAGESVAEILAIRDHIPEFAHRMMSQDAGLREIVINTAREYRLVGQMTTSSVEESAIDGRLADLERRYGHEFPQHINRTEYAYLVNHLVEWAEGPEFPLCVSNSQFSR